MIDAATGSGKSKWLPSAIARYMPGRLLVLTPSSVDVRAMCEDAVVGSGWKRGNTERGKKNCGGDPWGQIMFWTVGYAKKRAAGLRNDAQDAAGIFDGFETVLLDECHEVYRDGGYSLLLDIAYRRACDPAERLVLVVASGTPGSAVQRWISPTATIVCSKRPYDVQCFRVEERTVDEEQTLALTARTTSKAWHSRCTVLVFVATKKEIATVMDALNVPGVPQNCMHELHADVAEKDELSALTSRSYPRVIVSTSYAEQAVTIPDVDVVIDMGYCMLSFEQDTISALSKFVISEATSKQRAGRAGRTHPGVYVIINAVPREADVLHTPESLDFVAAVQQTEEVLGVRQEDIARHRRRWHQLGVSDALLLSLAVELPCSMQHAHILKTARNTELQVVAACIVACIEAKCLKARGTPWSVADVADTLRNPKTKAAHKASEQFDQLCYRMWLRSENLRRLSQRSDMSEAISELWHACGVAPVRVCHKQATFMGHQWECKVSDGHYVPVGMRLVNGFISCPLMLTSPRISSVPTRTAIVVSDSTMDGSVMTSFMACEKPGTICTPGFAGEVP